MSGPPDLSGRMASDGLLQTISHVVPPPPPDSPPSLPWPFAPRPNEVAAVTAAASAAGIAIYGEAGVGKTSLARVAVEALTRGDRPRFHLALAATPARRSIPLSVLEPLLGGFDSASQRGAFALGAELTARLNAHADGRPVVIQVDDAQHLDDISAELLAALCRAGRIALVLTVRTGDPVPVPVVALWKDDVVERLDLGPLDRDSIAELLRRALGGEVEVDASWDIWQATRGNPFQVRETVRQAVESGALARRDGVWAWTGRPKPGRRLVEVVRDELAAIADGVRQVVELVALAEPLPLASLLRHASPSDLDDAIDTGLVTVQPSSVGIDGGTATITHPLYAEAIRDLLRPGRRRDLFRLVHAEGQNAEGQGGGEHGETLPALLRSVAWALECDVDVPIARLRAAAGAAASLGEDAYVMRITEVILRTNSDPDVVVEVRLLRARTLRFVDRPDDALSELDSASEVAVGTEIPLAPDAARRALDIARLRADIAQYHHDDVDAALDVMATVTPTLEQVASADQRDSIVRTLEIDRLVRLGWAGRTSESVDASLTLLAQPDLSPMDALSLVAPAALGLASRGRMNEALELLGERFTDAVEHVADQPWSFQEMGAAAFMSHLLLGDIDGAEATLQASAEADDPLFRFERAAQQAGLGRVAAARGRWAEAEANFAAASARFSLRDHSGYRAWSVAWHAFTLAASGQGAAARRELAAVAEMPWRSVRIIEGDLRLAMARTAAALGEDDSRAQAVELFDLLRERDLRVAAVQAAHLALSLDPQAAGSDAMLEEMIQIAQDVDGVLAESLVAHATALVQGADGEQRTVLELAVTNAGVWLPVGRPAAGLSARQREVALLAAAGLSSRAIAERLFLSPRTVETHLASVFTKLGVHTRAELAEVLGS